MNNLKSLTLHWNFELSGPLPRSFTELQLRTLFLGDTGLCVPTDATFQAWLRGITTKSGVENCQPP